MRADWRTQEPKRPYGAAWEDMFARRKLTRWGNFFWISPAPLLASINDKIVKGLDDLVNEVRSRWLAAQRAAGRLDQGVAVRAYADKEALSFLILGDPGEQDASQYAVIEPLLDVGDDTNFLLIASDVIYPAVTSTNTSTASTSRSSATGTRSTRCPETTTGTTA